MGSESTSTAAELPPGPDQTARLSRSGPRKTKGAIIKALPPRIDGSPESSSSLTRPSTCTLTRSVCQVSPTWTPLASDGTLFT